MNRFKRVLLVNPMGTEQLGYTPSPLGILYLAAYLRKHLPQVKISVIDGAIKGKKAVINRLIEFKPDLVGISVLTPNRHQAVGVAKLAKRICPRIKVVIGGIHPTLMWNQIMEYYPQIDYIVRGEGELTLFDLVNGKKLERIDGLVWRRRGRQIVNNPDRNLINDLNNLPFPAWDLVDFDKYPARGEGVVEGIDLTKEMRFSIIFSRGCMGNCTFCSSWKIWKGYRYRKGKNVAGEVELMVNKYNAKHICFYDDTLTGNRNEIINFCQEIVRRKIKVAFFGTTRIDKVDLTMLRWMGKAGFYELSFGIESGSPAMLIKINKRTDLKKIRRAIYLTKKAKIRTCALMMYGMPGETDEDRRLTKKLLSEIKPDGIGTVGEVWIFPGTALYEQAKHAGLLNDRFWLGRKPYYIYRGGIANDPVKKALQFQDEVKFNIQGTFLETIGYKMLTITKNLLN